MNPTARRIDQILTDTPLAASLIARLTAARHAARIIAPVCAEVVPGFDPLRPGACDLRNAVLQVWLVSGAQATKLRQAIPRLKVTLQSNNIEVSEIKVRIQLGRLREPLASKPPNSTGKAAQPAVFTPQQKRQLHEITKFSSKLALTLPDSPLRRAIAGLGRVADERLARMRESAQPFDDEAQQHHRADQQAQRHAGVQDAPRPGEVARLAREEVQGDAADDQRTEDNQ
jgi:hypothetical protein